MSSFCTLPSLPQIDPRYTYVASLYTSDRTGLPQLIRGIHGWHVIWSKYAFQIIIKTLHSPNWIFDGMCGPLMCHTIPNLHKKNLFWAENGWEFWRSCYKMVLITIIFIRFSWKSNVMKVWLNIKRRERHALNVPPSLYLGTLAYMMPWVKEGNFKGKNPYWMLMYSGIETNKVSPLTSMSLSYRDVLATRLQAYKPRCASHYYHSSSFVFFAALAIISHSRPLIHFASFGADPILSHNSFNSAQGTTLV